jgi:hypothetical protein
MILRLFACLLLLVSVTACNTLQAPYKKKDAEEKKAMKDQANDQAFQAFVGRLRIAVAKRDRAKLTSMMTSDFGYRWDNPPMGETAFDYWDKNGLWKDLDGLLKQKFAANEFYMMAPVQAVNDPTYTGYRVGIKIVGGSWKFAYFVPAEPKQ